MKNIRITLTLLVVTLSFSACRKIKYEEGEKLPRRKFLETINGVWKVEHYYRSIDLNTYSEDSIPVWNARYGGIGTLTIDYYENITLNWGNHQAVSYFSKEDKEVGYTYFNANYYYTEELRKDTSFKISIQYLPIYSDVVLVKLDEHNLILLDAPKHGDRLILTK